MLRGIPSILNPDLLKIMMEMGHGDTLVIGDGNCPAAACAKRLVRCDGHGATELLDAIMTFFPLDTYVEKPVAVMATADGEDAPIWKEYQQIIARREGETAFEQVERFDFYARARDAYAVISTGEGALYANIILTKGVVIE